MAEAGDDIRDFRFVRGTSQFSADNVNIYGTDTTGAGIPDLQAGDGLDTVIGADNSGLEAGEAYKIIVSFNQEEVIAAGQTVTYHLRATVVNSDDDDSVTVSLADDDDNTPVSGLTVNNGNANTGRIYDADANQALFTGAAPADADFSQLYDAAVARNIIWSDMSADIHSYPTVAAGVVTDATGSYDWTNGYKLELNALDSRTLTN